MNSAEIGNRIKIYRKELQLTQENLAEKIDVSPHYIYEIERGSKNMSLNILIKLAGALSVSTDYLLLGHPADTPQDSDQLSLILSQLSPKEREYAASILLAIFPHLKDV